MKTKRNIGEEIITLGKLVFFLGIFFALLAAVLAITTKDIDPHILHALLFLLSGFCLSTLIVGFGQLIVNTDRIVKLLKHRDLKEWAEEESAPEEEK